MSSGILGSDRTAPLSVEAARELRDGLRRRQKELPPQWLAAVYAAALRSPETPAPGHPLEATERDLALGLIASHLPEARPRGILCVQPSASAASVAIVESLCERGSVTSIAATELDATLSTGMLERIVSRAPVPSVAALACDCSVDLPLPDNFPRPRVYLCLGNALGSTTTVGAVRMLRILRTTMIPGDTIVLGLDVRPETPADAAATMDTPSAASMHFGALDLVNSTTGASFDRDRFEYRPSYDVENHRLETHLVARRGFTLEVPGVGDVRFRKGESIRTSVRCTFERSRVTAMMGGVGLMLREWVIAPGGTYVAALATTAA